MPMWCLVLIWCQVPIIYHTPHFIALMIYHTHVMTHAHVISHASFDVSCQFDVSCPIDASFTVTSCPIWCLIHSDIMPHLMPHAHVISCPIWWLMPMFFFWVEKSLNSFTVIIKSPTAMDYCQSKCIWLCIVFFTFENLKILFGHKSF